MTKIGKADMTVDVKERHKELHQSVDELLACYIEEMSRPVLQDSLMQFMEWSHAMTENPTCVDKHKKEG